MVSIFFITFCYYLCLFAVITTYTHGLSNHKYLINNSISILNNLYIEMACKYLLANTIKHKIFEKKKKIMKF